MSGNRIGKSLARVSPSPQSGFRFVTRPFAAEPWQYAYRTAAGQLTQSRAFRGNALEDAGRPVPQERADTGPGERAGSAAPRHAADGGSPSGLPERLKAGIEHLSGLSMDAVSVHYDSPRPAPLDALAYAQGTDIHLGPGQETHLAHESWHVVQQMRGKVRPTLPAQDGVAINDDAGLEREAEVMGEQVLRTTGRDPTAGALPGRMTAAAQGPADARRAIIDPAMTEARPLAVTGWLGGHASRPGAGQVGRSPSPADVVQRLQAPPNPPKTEWNKATIPEPKGAIVMDSWLSYRGGDPRPQGWGPSADPPGYRYIRLCGLTHDWIRFHLVNAKAGGPGTDDNLVPTSQKTNQSPTWRNMEKAEQAEYDNARTYHFAVHVDYHAKNNAPALPGEHWQEYFPKQIDAALSTVKGAAWHTVNMPSINPLLPPLNPKQIDYNLTNASGDKLNKLLDTEILGKFMAVNSHNLVVPGMTAVDFIDNLYDKIGDWEEGKKQKRLFSEADRVANLLHDFITGQGTIKINLK